MKMNTPRSAPSFRTAAPRGVLFLKDDTSAHRHQVIAARADAELFTVNEGFFPGNVRIAVEEVIMVMVPVGLCKVVAELGIPDRLCFEAEVGAGLIESDRIKGREHADIRQDRRVIFTMAVTVRRNILDQGHMEGRAVSDDSGGVLGDLHAEDVRGIAVIIFNRVESAGTEAAAAALAEVLINSGRSVGTVVEDRVGTALLRAAMALSAHLRNDVRLAVIVL